VLRAAAACSQEVTVLTVLGKPRAGGDAVDLLLECHDRIRSFLSLARRIAAARQTDDVAEAAARVVRYFTEALPLHARDEEQSVLPRLAGRDPAVDEALAIMAREHGEHETPLAALVEACAAIAEDPGRHREVSPTLTWAVGALDVHFEAHLRREEEIIFPAARRLLSETDLAAIARELRQRRGVTAAPNPR
jgi:hemerythrin-like domain-containing protein